MMEDNQIMDDFRQIIEACLKLSDINLAKEKKEKFINITAQMLYGRVVLKIPLSKKKPEEKILSKF